MSAEVRLGASSFKSVAEMWQHRVESTPESEAMTWRREGRWITATWRQAGERVRAIGNGLLALGLEPEERVCLLSATRVEWILADLGTLCAGGATSTIYPSNTSEECAYIVNDCEGAFIVCDTATQVQKLISIRSQLPSVRKVITFDGPATADGWVMPLAELERLGQEFSQAHPQKYNEVREAITPDRLATLIYTSGTTGQPKGVMLTHDSWVYEAEAVDALGLLTPADKQYLFLPLYHVFAKVMQVVFIRLGIPTVIDGDIDSLIANLAETQPTWMGAVPRIFEKAYVRTVTQGRESGRAQRALFEWALSVGREVSRERQERKTLGAMLKLKYQIADRLVFSKVKQRFGGRLRFLISGAAPLSKEIAEFFHACDILILEGYGLTESSAATCVNGPDDFVFGTVGRPLPGTQVKIAEDGEILLKGRGIMRGYYGQPEATAEAISADGWLRTGDIGVLLPSGHLQITDRKKELIVTAGGKNIAPAHFQNLLKARCPYVSQVVMHGDKRPFCVALVAINEEMVRKWATEKKIPHTDYADLASKTEVRNLILSYVDQVNRELPSYETVKGIALLPEDLSQENGMLTPSLKVKRRAVEQRYQSELDAFYTALPQT